MKKACLTLFIISIFTFSYCQEKITDTHFVIGGSLNFLTQTNTYPFSTLGITSGIGGIYSNGLNDSKNSVFTFSPYIGKELNPNLLIGLRMNFRKGNYETKTIPTIGQPEQRDLERQSNQIGVGVLARYMFNPENTFVFYTQPYFNYNSLGEDEFLDSDLNQEEKVNFIELGIGFGGLYQVSDLVRLTINAAGINYTNGSWSIEGTDISQDFSAFNTAFNLSSIQFGVEFTL